MPIAISIWRTQIRRPRMKPSGWILNRWLAKQFPHVAGLAKLPFERTVHEKFCTEVGWNVCREDWYPETCFEVRFKEIGRRLVAVYLF